MAVSLGYRAAVAGRIVLAAFGGYGLAAASTALLSLTLPLERSEAVTAATLSSFAIMAFAVLYVFAARSLGRAALGIGIPLVLIGGGLWFALSVLKLGGGA